MNQDNFLQMKGTNEQTTKEGNDPSLILKIFQKETQNTRTNIEKLVPKLHRKAPFVYIPCAIKNINDFQYFSQILQNWNENNANCQITFIKGCALKEEFGKLIEDLNLQDQSTYSILKLDLKVWSEQAEIENLQDLIEHYHYHQDTKKYPNLKQKQILTDEIFCNHAFKSLGVSLNLDLNFEDIDYIMSYNGKDHSFLIIPKSHIDDNTQQKMVTRIILLVQFVQKYINDENSLELISIKQTLGDLEYVLEKFKKKEYSTLKPLIKFMRKHSQQN